MSKTRIAVVIALLLAAPAAVVALEEYASTEAMQQPQIAEGLPSEASAPEQYAAQEPALVIAETTTVVVVEPVTPVYTAPRISSVQTMSENDPLNPFNQADMLWFKPLPAQAKYFAQQERERATRIAGTSNASTMAWLPHDADTEGWKPLPAQAAYFERLEQQRIASAQSAPVARSKARAQAGSAELTLADSSPHPVTHPPV